MKLTIFHTLFYLMLITPIPSIAQYVNTSFDVSFRSGSELLVDSYSGNSLVLHQIDNQIRECKAKIIGSSGYIQLVAGVSLESISDNFALNNGAIQASVVKRYLIVKYGFTDSDFVFCFDDRLKANSVQIYLNAKNTPKYGSEKIFFALNKTDATAVNAAIALYGANIPLRGANTPIDDKEKSITEVTIQQQSHRQSQQQSQESTSITTSETDRNLAQEQAENYLINFRYGSETLYSAYMDNKRVLSDLKLRVSNNRSTISEQRGHIRIVSVIDASERGNIAAINFASIRGAVVRQWLRDNFSWLADTDFSFYISTESNRNVVEVSFVDSPIKDKRSSDIFFSLSKNYPEKVDYAVARYRRIPFLDDAPMFERRGMDFGIIDPMLDPMAKKIVDGAIDEQIVVTIYYRWDKDNLDRVYLTNAKTLTQVDSLFRLKSAYYIDSLCIVAYASPEGPPNYNQRLSERRAATLKRYLLSTYPHLRDEQVVTVAKGENWDGFLRMALADPKLPMKEQVLSIINNPNINDLQRHSQIARLDGGRLYKNYILPNYYRYLRTGASLFVIYNQNKPLDVDFEPIVVAVVEPLPEPEPIVLSYVENPKPAVVKYPIALRSNLLYDAVGVVNLGVEFPIKKHFSVIGDFAYSYWRSPKNLYALQTLEYGAELRYWFGVNDRLEKRNLNWAKPLKGFNIGLYGRYWQRYDVQWTDGYQGDGTWSAGVTVGYSFPIGKRLSFEAGLGAGWLSTSQYRHYHQPEYDAEGKYHLMWQETGVWSGLSITKVRFSLVWLIEYQKRGGQL